jgi:dTDP-4-dehydrorhamnose 3,5-epimerase
LTPELITPPLFEDHRGCNFTLWDPRTRISVPKFVSDNVSMSCKHTLRGIHGDDKTWKLISCLHGRVFFVVVSPERRIYQWILSDENHNQVIVPAGYGNAHLVLSEKCVIHYKMSEYIDRQNQFTWRWNDPKLAIKWPIEHPILSERDSTCPLL